MGDAIFNDKPLTNGYHDVPGAMGDDALEAIAIVGLSCRYPGSSNPQKLWTNLATGTSAWSKGPQKRFNMEAFYDPNNSTASVTNTNGGHFLDEDIAAFDAPFFGIHAVEARAMDPQQRMMLEVAYESFENAGMTTEQLWSSNAGVYVGQWTSDYAEVLSRDTEYPATYHVTGSGPAITSNRISYQFNLQGPSLTVDTGCSSSLVALHLAVQSLRSKETEMAFVGGVNLLADPQRFTYQSKLKMFSVDGKSFAFDHRANGYGRGEGCGGLVLKPLSKALRDGDNVRAIIRNTVLNQDGRTPGISVPSGEAQEKAIRKAYKDAGLDLSVDYVEAHGTGTAVGDPIEVEAIASALSKDRNPNNKLPIGSIKGNIGHTESAAGVAGLIKAVLMLEKGSIPPQVNFEKPNEKILVDDWNLKINSELESRALNRISVNSFGYGGTNAHVIVENAKHLQPAVETQPATTVDVQPRVFIISGASENSCQSFATTLAEFVSLTSTSITDKRWMDRLAYTLNRRTKHRHRAIVVAETPEVLVSSLKAIAEQPVAANTGDLKTRIGFVFSGQGAQYFNMGRELINVWPDFTSSLKRANRHLAKMGCTWDVFTELERDAKETRLDEPRFGQPLSTAIQLALIDTLSALGIEPTAVAGHSSGEIAASYAAGYLSFENAMKVSYHRGRLTSQLLDRETDLQGGMIAVGASSRVVDGYIASLPDSERLTIACYNSPSSVTVSGDMPAIQELSKLLEEESVFNRVLRTRGAAYHSDQMRRIEDEYREALEGLEVETSETGVTMVSSLTGSPIEDAHELNEEYWCSNLVSPVYFEDALWGLCQADDGSANVDMVLEIGPHSTLEGPVKQTIQTFEGDASGVKYVNTLKRKVSASKALLGCLGHLFSDGVDFDFHYANGGFEDEMLTLMAEAPPYAFDHEQTYWHESRVSKEYTQRQFLPHELIGNLSADVNRLEPRWRRILTLKELPWLQNHVIQGQCVFPAAGYLAMALEGMRRFKKMSEPAIEIEGYTFRSINIGKALVISQDSADEVCLSIRPEPRSARGSSSSWMEFRIFTVASGDSWNEHCRGLINVTTIDGNEAHNAKASDLASFQRDVQGAIENSQQSVSPQKFYYLSRDIGLDWKSPFDNVVELKLGDSTSVGKVQCPDVGSETTSLGEPKYVVHPGTLDSALFHGLCSILLLKNGLKSPAVPTFIQDLYISAKYSEVQGSQLTCYSTRKEGHFTFDVGVSEGSGANERVVVRAEGVTATQLPGDVILSSSRELVHQIQWVTYTEDMTPKHVEELCSSVVTRDSVAGHNKHLDARVLSHIQRAIKALPLSQVSEEHHRHWYDWMQSHATDRIDVSKMGTHGLNQDLEGEAEAISRIGDNLVDILSGKTEPLALLQDGGLLSSLYSNERCQRCYSQMSAYVSELVKQKPGMKVIEIGAGTGSASEPMLKAMCPDGRRLISRYDFTDISPSFFETVKGRLADFSDVVNYRVLDVEQDPTAQGLEEGSYDLAIACNVIHATSSIGDSLDRVRALLRPGGVLLLMEITKDALYYNLVFGSLPGWWAGDKEGRRMSPLIPDSEWNTTLTSHGFNKPMATFKDYEESSGGTLSVFLATTTPAYPKSLVHQVQVITDKSKTSEISGLVDTLSVSLGAQNVSSSDLMAPTTSEGITVFPPEVCEAFIEDVDPKSWDSFKSRLLTSKAVLFITRGATRDCKRPRGAMLTGFARSFRIEHQDIRMVNVDFDLDTDVATCRELVTKVLKSPSFDLEQNDADVEHEFSEHQGQLYVPRAFQEKTIGNHVRDSNGQSKPEMASFLDNDRTLVAQTEVAGLLDTLRWKDDEDSGPPGPDEIQIELRAASINFKDVLIAAGQLEGVTEMRNDCAGIVTHVGINMMDRFRKGDRVCCYYSRSYTNRPRVHGDCCAVIPERLSFEEAASLPIVWATVYYSLIHKGRLAKGESVLIHSAAGAVGQAAIILAQHIGAEVFVTCGSADKRTFLTETYGISDDHIFSSRTTAFGKAIRDMTGKGGVDVVLNSLGGDVFRESCNTVAPYGRFVEIGRKEFLDDMLMPAKFLLKNITFAYVDLALLIDDNKPLVGQLLQNVMDLMSYGAIRPTSITTMPISEIEAAFRHIQAGKHIGKVILKVEDDQQVKIVPPAPAPAQLKHDGAYLVIGGLGGLGKGIVRWMGAHGARRIIAVSRSGTCDDEAVAVIQDMRSQGISVEIERCDITSLPAVEALIKKIERGQNASPIRGVIQSAMVVKDTRFDNMEYEQWYATHRPKTKGTWNLYTALPKTIDFLVMMSSAVAISGNAGQTNYAGACTYQDALAHFLRTQGLPAYSINVGAVADSGFVAENPEVAAALRRKGFGTIATKEMLATLNYVLANTGAFQVDDCQCVIGLVPKGNEPGLRPGVWVNDSKFRHLSHRNSGSQESSDSGEVGETISSAQTAEEAVNLICEAIIQQLSKLLATPVKYLSEDRSLDDYGVDSLVAVELRNWIGAFLQANIPLLVLRKTTSVRELGGLVAKESRLVSVKPE